MAGASPSVDPISRISASIAATRSKRVPSAFANVAASDANVLENALEVVVHEGAFKEHLATLEAARKSAAHETAMLRAQVEELGLSLIHI